jgi:protein-tyrosine phosphatase
VSSDDHIPPQSLEQVDAAGRDPSFSVVFVCSGNLVRSPLAAALLARHTRGSAVVVGSRGTLDVGAQAPPAEAIGVGAALGVDLTSHRSRTLVAGELTTTDLVIGFEPFHVAAAVVEGGAAPARAFTIRELAALLPDVAGMTAGDSQLELARTLVAAAAQGRGDRGARLSALSLADPFGRPRRAYEQTAAQVDEIVTQIADTLFGSGSVRQAV